VRDGDAPRIAQDEASATYEGWCKAADVVIDWAMPARKVYDMVRGSNPQPGANTTFNGQPVSFYECSLDETGPGTDPGAVTGISNGSVKVALNGGTLDLARVRAEGGRKVSASEFAEDAGLRVGDRFGT
jgi:methionyl-tRNA formyltransferase